MSVQAVEKFKIASYLRRQTSPSIELRDLGSRRCCSVGGATIQVAEEPWRGSGSDPARAGKLPWRHQTNAMLELSQLKMLSWNTYILLLLMNMADLEPDIFLRQRAGRRIDNVFETL
jgi:hypothetical protein